MHMVASSVPGLQAENVSIIDNRGTLLSYGNDETNMAKLTNSQKYKRKVEQQYQIQLTNMYRKNSRNWQSKYSSGCWNWFE